MTLMTCIEFYSREACLPVLLPLELPATPRLYPPPPGSLSFIPNTFLASLRSCILLLGSSAIESLALEIVVRLGMLEL